MVMVGVVLVLILPPSPPISFLRVLGGKYKSLFVFILRRQKKKLSEDASVKLGLGEGGGVGSNY